MNEIGLGHKILFFLRECDNLVNDKFQMPVVFEIDASNACQNDCDFCMFAFHIKKHRVHLSMDTFRKAIWDFYRSGVRAVTFTGGGEPLMNPSIRAMIEYADHLGMKVGLVTNGIFLDRVFDLSDKLEYVRVSIDCASPQTYRATKHTDNFYPIINNIKKLTAMGKTDVGISFVITDQNHDEIDAFYDLAKHLNVHYAQIKPELKDCDMEAQTKDVDRGKFFVTERYNIDQTSLTACKIAGLIGVLNATGDVYYCCIHRGKDEFKIGNINDQSLLEIYTRRAQFKPNLKMCGGSCRYMNYAKIYEQVRGDRFIPLRHRRFI